MLLINTCNTNISINSYSSGGYVLRLEGLCAREPDRATGLWVNRRVLLKMTDMVLMKIS